MGFSSLIDYDYSSICGGVNSGTRSLSSVCYIVPHVTAGTNDAQSVASYWATNRTGSAHYVVDKTGHVAGCVDETKIAWAIRGANSKSISIEMINTGGIYGSTGDNGAKSWPVSLATLNKTAKLMADIAGRLGWDVIDWDCPTAGTLGNDYRCTKSKTYTDSNGLVHGYIGGHCWFAGNDHACPAGYMKIGGTIKGNNNITAVSPLQYIWMYANALMGGAIAEADLHWIQEPNYSHTSGNTYEVTGYAPFTPFGNECTNNARIIANYCMNTLGMTKECVCGIMGNWTWESGLNPDTWNWQGPSSARTWSVTNHGTSYTFTKTDSGYGLGQWTPSASGYNYIANLAPSDWMTDADGNGNAQLNCLEVSSLAGQWNTQSGYTWAQFKQLTLTASAMAELFVRWWEVWSGSLPSDGSAPNRKAYAQEWYDTWDDWYVYGTVPIGGLDPWNGATYFEKYGNFWLMSKRIIL